MISFELLYLMNFMSFMKATLPLRDQGLMLVEGINEDSSAADSNGAGKSVLFEALTWCLWGKTVRGMSADEIVNDLVLKDCAVQTQFAVNEQPAKVTRYRKHSQFGNALSLEINGDKFSEGIQETQRKINSLLGCDFETFINAKYFSQELLKRFTQATDSERKSIFDRILGLERLEACREITRSQIQNCEQKIDGLDKNRQSLLLLHANAKDEIVRLTVEEKQFEEKKKLELEDIKVDQAEVCKSIKQAKIELEKKPKLLELLKQLEEIVGKIPELEAKKVKLLRQTEKLAKAAAVLGEKQRFYESDATALTAKLKSIQEGKLEGEPCPFCKRTITESCLEKLGKYYRDLIAAQEKDAETYKTERQKLLNSKAKVVKQDEAVSEEALGAYKAEERKDSVEQSLKDLEQSAQRVEELKEQLLKLEGRRKAKQKETSGYTKLKQEKEVDLCFCSEKLGAVEKELKSQQESKKYFEFWETGFGNQGLKSFILDSILPTLNSKADYYSRILTGGEFIVSFKTQSQLKSGEERERFAIEISQKGSKRSYKASSAGEKRRVDLCVLLALQGLVASFGPHDLNILFFDEIFDALDKTGSEKVTDLLIEESRGKDSVFVITHSEDLRNYFDNIITVTKKGGVSKIS